MKVVAKAPTLWVTCGFTNWEQPRRWRWCCRRKKRRKERKRERKTGWRQEFRL
jgi:hypothetical protein